MQVRRLVEQLTNPAASTSASTVSPVPPAAAAPAASYAETSAAASSEASSAAPTRPPAKKTTTFQANADAPSYLFPLPKISPLKATQKTATQAQTERNNKRKIYQLYAAALKQSTT